jgi:hypothetical protein
MNLKSYRITNHLIHEYVIKSIGIDVIIATTDTEDFNRLLKQHHIEARRWRDIKPWLNS